MNNNAITFTGLIYCFINGLNLIRIGGNLLGPPWNFSGINVNGFGPTHQTPQYKNQTINNSIHIHLFSVLGTYPFVPWLSLRKNGLTSTADAPNLFPIQTRVYTFLSHALAAHRPG